MQPVRRHLLVLVLLLSVGSVGSQCAEDPSAIIVAPLHSLLTEPGEVPVLFFLLPGFDPSSAAILLEGETGTDDVTSQVHHFGPVFYGEIDVPDDGDYRLLVQATGAGGSGESGSAFQVVSLANADECEVLNAVECLLPYPSQRFLAQDPSTPNGLRLSLPAVGLTTDPPLNPPTSPAPWNELDGFSPTAPILMNFPAGVDLAASGADILIPPDFANPQTKPYSGVRTQSGISVMPWSPTVIIKASTGERVMHFAELDSRANGNPARQALILRPSIALDAGERYIVAVRNLVDGGGDPIEPEPAFRVIRDWAPSTIDAVEERRWYFEQEIFGPLADAAFPVPRENLQLAFDFTIMSDDVLTGQVFSMQQQAYDWLANEVDVLSRQTFTVLPFGTDRTMSQAFDCSVPGTPTWRILRGTYEVPLFLTEDLADVSTLGVLNLDANGDPVQNGVTQAVYTLSIPCAAFNAGEAAQNAIILGHGLFGTGDGMVQAFSETFAESGSIASTATDWRGLSTPDLLWVGGQIVGSGGVNQFNNFPAFVDRLKQGQINTQLLARMMKRGDFNVDPAFQVAPGVGGLPGPDEELFYYGISLGGIMGTFFAALTEDVERFNVDVPGMNFAMLQQRSTQFTVFEQLLDGVGLSEPLEVLISLSVQHDLWVRGEPGGYVHHLADAIANDEKKLLVTAAWLDKQVSNQATEILVRSLGVPMLEGSVMEGVLGIPDVAGTVDNAYVIYDQGTFDIYDPVQTVLHIPPLRNAIPSDVCDPHSDRVTIPASVEQLLSFLTPGGLISNFCDGVCDGAIGDEQPGGGPPCALP